MAYAQTNGRWIKYYEDNNYIASYRSDIQTDGNNHHFVWIQYTYISSEFRLYKTNQIESSGLVYSALEKVEFDSEYELERLLYEGFLSKTGEVLHEWEGEDKWGKVKDYKAYKALAPKLNGRYSKAHEESKKQSDNVLTETNSQSDIVYEKLLDKIKDKQNNQEEKGDDSSIDKKKSPHRLFVSNIEYGAISESKITNTNGLLNMIDGKPSTAWVVNLDQASYDCDAIYGPIFTLHCKKLTHIVINNGYAKSYEAYRNNARALRLIFCNFDYLSDENKQASYLYEGIIKDTPEKQTLVVDPRKYCNDDIKKIQIIFPVDGLQYGTKWKDLCISEIDFWGY